MSSGEYNLYSYVDDSNFWNDIFGLAKTYRQRLGDFGEDWAKNQLKKSGKYTKVFSVQNKSGHGLDIVAKRKDGKYDVFEVKTTRKADGAGTLSKKQKDADAYIDEVLSRDMKGYNISSTQADNIASNIGDKRIIDVNVGTGENGKWYVDKVLTSSW